MRLKESGGFLLEGITITLMQPKPGSSDSTNKNDERGSFVGRWVSIFAQWQVQKDICLTVCVRFLVGLHKMLIGP